MKIENCFEHAGFFSPVHEQTCLSKDERNSRWKKVQVEEGKAKFKFIHKFSRKSCLPNSFFLQRHIYFFIRFSNGLIRSMGSGNIIVEFFSAAMLFRVCEKSK